MGLLPPDPTITREALEQREIDDAFWYDLKNKHHQWLASRGSLTSSSENSETAAAEQERRQREQILRFELDTFFIRMSHLVRDTSALGEEKLPIAPYDPSFPEICQRLAEKMKASGELAAREAAFREYLQEESRIDQELIDIGTTVMTHAGTSDGQNKVYDALVAKHRTLCYEASVRAVEIYYLRLIEIGNRFKGSYEKLKPVANRRSVVRQLKPLGPIIRFKSDNINNGAVSFLSRAGQAGPEEGFAYGLKHNYRDLVVTFGLPSSDRGDTLFAMLARNGAKMVKAHFALWGRWYEEGGQPGGFLTVSINQFCADLGYKPNKGAYRPEHKQSAREILDAITSIEMRAIFTPPDKKPAQRLRGPIWSRGLICEEDGWHGGSAGKHLEGVDGPWKALNFSYAPGPWFTHEAWKQYNRAIGKIGASLMQLQNDKDEWAILIGGYLATMLRPAQYHPRRLRVMTILDRTGLAQSQDARRRASELQDRFEHAMNSLVEVGVLESWFYTDGVAEDLEDTDNADAVAAYYADNAAAAMNFRRRVVEVVCPFVEDANRLTKKTEARIEARERKRKKA